MSKMKRLTTADLDGIERRSSRITPDTMAHGIALEMLALVRECRLLRAERDAAISREFYRDIARDALETAARRADQ